MTLKKVGLLCFGILACLGMMPHRAWAADLASENGKSLIVGHIRIVTRNVREIDFATKTMTLYLKPPGLPGIILPFTPQPNANLANNIVVILEHAWLVEASNSQTTVKVLNPALLDISYCQENETSLGKSLEDIFDGLGHKVASVFATYRAKVACQDGVIYNGSTF